MDQGLGQSVGRFGPTFVELAALMSDPLNILLVDDDQQHIDQIEHALRESETPPEIHCVRTLAAAREHIAAGEPSVAIVDLNLPDGSGLALLPARREDITCPILIMTSHGNESIAVDAIRSGAVDYIVKSESTFAAMPRILDRAIREWNYITDTRRAIAMATLFSRIVDDSINEIYIFDALTLEFLQVNQGARNRLGFTEAEMLDMRITDLLPGFAPDEFLGLMEPLESDSVARQHFTAVHLHSDGSLSPIEAYVQRTVYGDRPAFVMIALDISQRVEMEEERTRLEMQLRQSQKLQTIGTLSGGIAHDFNNLLTPIIVNTHMVMGDLEPGSLAATRLERVTSAASRAKDLVRQILTFSRQVKHEIRAVRIDEVVEDALSLVRASIPSSIDIEVDVDADCGMIMADETQVHQVAVNLCTNAYHAIGESQGTIEVSLRRVSVTADLARQQPNLHAGNYVAFRVRDTGHGMDKATRERVFDPFFTTKEPGKGTGLGLSVVHGIVIGHGGGITIESEPGVGTTFVAFFPRAEGAVAEDAPEAKDEFPHRGTQRVMYVDDEAEGATLGREMLHPLGYDVTIFTDPLEAIKAFTKNVGAFDVIVTDQVMPNLTGVDLARRVHEIEPKMPIVLVTGFSHTVTSENIAEFGIHEFLHKPVLPQDLGRAIQRAVRVTGAKDG